MSVKLAPTSMHVLYTCTGPTFLFVIAISNHLRGMLQLNQTTKVVMNVTIALDQQAGDLQLHPTNSQDGNEHLQYADLLLRICFVLVRCTLYFLSFWVILSILHIQFSS